MTDRFPDYDVLAKQDSQSWNDQTRSVIARRLALDVSGHALNAAQVATLRALADRITPQPEGRPAINVVAILSDKIDHDEGDGARPAGFPRIREAWQRGLDAIEAEARARTGHSFVGLDDERADTVLRAIERGDVTAAAWGDLSPVLFWSWRLIPDIVSAYYAHPSAWSAIGFGGPASPRGYVRLQADKRDPWEAAEIDDGRLLPTRWRNRHVG